MDTSEQRKLPDLTSDEAAELFVDAADLSQFDLSGFRPAGFEFEKKDVRINTRVPRPPVR